MGGFSVEEFLERGNSDKKARLLLRLRSISGKFTFLSFSGLVAPEIIGMSVRFTYLKILAILVAPVAAVAKPFTVEIALMLNLFDNKSRLMAAISSGPISVSTIIGVIEVFV